MTKTKTLEIVMVCDWCGGKGWYCGFMEDRVDCVNMDCNGTGKITKRIKVIEYMEV